MRTAYREHLDNFSHDLIVMCDTVRTIMDKASQALLDRALEPAEEALSLTEELDEIRSRCSERAVKLLALENPMAQDLRQVVSSIYIVEDLFRMGQLAQHIADAARRRRNQERQRLAAAGARRRDHVFSGQQRGNGPGLHGRGGAPTQ